jgi:hypothetical protein
MRTALARFQELDDLVLHLKGLVLVRDIRRHSGADDEELTMYSDQIRCVRERLAELVRNGARHETAAGQRYSASR